MSLLKLLLPFVVLVIFLIFIFKLLIPIIENKVKLDTTPKDDLLAEAERVSKEKAEIEKAAELKQQELNKVKNNLKS